MTTIAIVGAGSGLGMATGRRFGREGFSVALIARSQDKLDRLAAELADDRIPAVGYAADVQNRTAPATSVDRCWAVAIGVRSGGPSCRNLTHRWGEWEDGT
ncbi:SDR family NAD(P)-dependent oxidoreductase [Nocardia sp. NPDC050408]|uniref:SDR family NAD(P)-dependent oxidoreductase n=1 Tax=Nocardia sp. NPDC050408 TaxID=3364319 RepID=UPI0037B737AF